MRKHQTSHKIRGIDILFEDECLIVVNKDCGILTEETRRHEPFTAENAINTYIRKGQLRSSKRVFLVHRLDRETSGVLIFAKDELTREKLQAVWHEKVEKTYLAALWGTPSPENGSLTGYLYEDKNLFVRQVPSPDSPLRNPSPGTVAPKFAKTDYEVIAEHRGLSLVKVHLCTGRRNQIRVQFACAGHPIVGDDKYGQSMRPFKDRLCLHSLSISFPHPKTGRQLFIETPVPAVFPRLFPSLKSTGNAPCTPTPLSSPTSKNQV